MSELDDLGRAVEKFNAKYRGPAVEPPKPSDPYDIDRDHPRRWPHAESPGVHTFFDGRETPLRSPRVHTGAASRPCRNEVRLSPDGTVPLGEWRAE